MPGSSIVGSTWRQVTIRQRRPLILAGNELPWYKPAADLSDCPKSDSPAGRPLRILLAHSPDQFKWAQANDVDLMLAGHLHGGQVRLPLLGAITSPSIHGVRYVAGRLHRWQHGDARQPRRGLAHAAALRLPAGNRDPHAALQLIEKIRARSLDLLDLDANAAGANGLVNVRKPQLVLPTQAERLAQLHQILPIVRAAVPEAARPRAGETVLRREQQHAAPPCAARGRVPLRPAQRSGTCSST